MTAGFICFTLNQISKKDSLDKGEISPATTINSTIVGQNAPSWSQDNELTK